MEITLSLNFAQTRPKGIMFQIFIIILFRISSKIVSLSILLLLIILIILNFTAIFL